MLVNDEGLCSNRSQENKEQQRFILGMGWVAEKIII